MCQNNPDSLSSSSPPALEPEGITSPVTTIDSALQAQVEQLQRVLLSLHDLMVIDVDDAWLQTQESDDHLDLEQLLESDDEDEKPADLAKLPTAPKFPNSKEGHFRLQLLPMWLSNFELAAINTARRLKGKRSTKISALSWWMTSVNQDQHPELHKVLHQPYRGFKVILNDIKLAFGHNEEKYDKFIRNKVLHFDGIQDGELASQAWQRFKAAYREANQRNLIQKGDRRELLDKVRAFCNQCSPLLERMGALLRLKIRGCDGSFIEKEDSPSFERMASIIDNCISQVEFERGILLRRNASENRRAPTQLPSHGRERFGITPETTSASHTEKRVVDLKPPIKRASPFDKSNNNWNKVRLTSAQNLE